MSLNDWLSANNNNNRILARVPSFALETKLSQ